MDAYISRQFRNGNLGPLSSVSELNGIGPYLLQRIKSTLKFRANQEVTLQQFVKKFANKNATEVVKTLQLMLQNQRANQCVADNTVSNDKRYHTRDVNQRGFDVCVALLKYAKRTNMVPNLRFGPLRSAIVRSESAKRCGCKPLNECNSNTCRRVGNACVPRVANARGFEGVDTEFGQKGSFNTALERQRLLSAASVRQNRSLNRDPDSFLDFNAGHTLQPDYVDAGNILWRVPEARVRRPRKL
jgi:hypothetical protein